MKKEMINPEELAKTPYGGEGAPWYSGAVKVGNTIYMSLQVARNEYGNIVGPGDFRMQAEKVIENIKVVLKSAGATLDDLVFTSVYITDVANIPVLVEILKKHFTIPIPPATEGMVVTSLVAREVLIEISGIAVVE